MGAVRLFLALVVAVDHWRLFVLVPLGITLEDYFKAGFNAGYAVLFFYVISGFLITYTLTRNYTPDLSGTRDFYRRRFIRIFSLYWPIVVLAFLLIPDAWANFAAKGFWDKLTSISLIGMDWRLAFASYPAAHFDAAIRGLGQAWTLGAELTFYLAAPWLLRLRKIALALLLLSFGARATLVAVDPSNYNWIYYFPGSTFGFFLLGHFACLAASRWPIGANRWLGLILLAGSFAAMTWGGSYAVFDGRRLWLSVLLFAGSLPGLFAATKDIRWLNLTGDLSYPIYLTHGIILSLFAPHILYFALPRDSMSATSAGYVSVAAFLGVAILGGAVAHWGLEKPVAAGMNLVVRWGRPRPRTA
jgi:peptidoglycan/LPS O-acetylase OafA/YrhL